MLFCSKYMRNYSTYKKTDFQVFSPNLSTIYFLIFPVLYRSPVYQSLSSVSIWQRPQPFLSYKCRGKIMIFTTACDLIIPRQIKGRIKMDILKRTKSLSVHLMFLCQAFFLQPLLATCENLFGPTLPCMTELSFIIIYTETISTAINGLTPFFKKLRCSLGLQSCFSRFCFLVLFPLEMWNDSFNWF